MGDWPLPVMATGQRDCFDVAGEKISCALSRQDEVRAGLKAPTPRFRVESSTV